MKTMNSPNQFSVLGNLPKTREEAAYLGRKMYMGETCPDGHSGERYTLNGDCVRCKKIEKYKKHGKSLSARQSIEAIHEKRDLDNYLFELMGEKL